MIILFVTFVFIVLMANALMSIHERRAIEKRDMMLSSACRWLKREEAAYKAAMNRELCSTGFVKNNGAIE